MKTEAKCADNNNKKKKKDTYFTAAFVFVHCLSWL